MQHYTTTNIDPDDTASHFDLDGHVFLLFYECICLCFESLRMFTFDGRPIIPDSMVLFHSIEPSVKWLLGSVYAPRIFSL